MTNHVGLEPQQFILEGTGLEPQKFIKNLFIKNFFFMNFTPVCHKKKFMNFTPVCENSEMTNHVGLERAVDIY